MVRVALEQLALPISIDKVGKYTKEFKPQYMTAYKLLIPVSHLIPTIWKNVDIV